MSTINYKIYIPILFFILLGCGQDEQVPDVSHIDVDLTIHRFDQDLKHIDTLHVADEMSRLREKYGEFYDLYFQKILPLRNDTPEMFASSIKGFLSNTGIQKLNDTIDIVFGDFDAETRRFEEAFRYYQYYFPDAAIPEIYTIMSEYSLQKFLAEVEGKEIMGLGLDMFLGRDYPYAVLNPKNPAFSQYLTRRFDKDHIVKKAMEMLVEEQMGNPPGDRLLDIMIHNGKKLYVLDKILPFEPDSIIMEYTADQMEWATDNELEMWAYFFKDDLFYKTNRMEINKYVNVSPQSPGMPIEAPGRTANYIGWQVVKAYMNRNTTVTLSDLIRESNAQRILDKSRYKPTR